jgi:hypothetical protein
VETYYKINLEEHMAMNKKQLINVTEQHKSWIASVVTAAEKEGHETNQTDIIRAILDEKMAIDPETFVMHLDKMKLRAKLEDIARRKAALQAEEEKLTEALQTAKAGDSIEATMRTAAR